MNRREFALLTLALSPTFAARAEAQVQEVPAWAQLFRQAGVQGAIAVLDARGGTQRWQVSERQRVQQRYSPASTFKIPHSLFALDAGLVRDEAQVFKWDGVARSRAEWNQDQTLRTAMRESTVWVYERFAQALGREREETYLQKIGYGNALASGAQPFWLSGDLAISALEQIAFLQRLYANQLPFAVAHQRLVKDLLVNDTGPDWTLRAKTGWTGQLGWWVGWVEWPTGPVYFAMNLDTPNRMKDLDQRRGIVRDVLRSLGAWPETL
jgi:beta-lactamase class D